MKSDSRDAILRAAQRKFVEHGYNRTTIRDIAAEAGVSAALIIKLFTSKSHLYSQAEPLSVPLIELDLPRELIGRALVQRIVSRRDEGAVEPWATIASSIRESPDPDAVRAQVADWCARTADLIGDATPARIHTAIVVSHLIGFAESIRVLGLYGKDEYSSDSLVDLWAPILQTRIDASRSTPSAAATKDFPAV